MKMEKTKVDDRQVYICTGTRTQTVNICTTANQRGEYEVTIRLPAQKSVTAVGIQKHSSIDSLVAWLIDKQDGTKEVAIARTGIKTGAEIEVLEDLPKASDPRRTTEDDLWIEQAVIITEQGGCDVHRVLEQAAFLGKVKPGRCRGGKPRRPFAQKAIKFLNFGLSGNNSIQDPFVFTDQLSLCIHNSCAIHRRVVAAFRPWL
jgi:hypothetical protein